MNYQFNFIINSYIQQINSENNSFLWNWENVYPLPIYKNEIELEFQKKIIIITSNLNKLNYSIPFIEDYDSFASISDEIIDESIKSPTIITKFEDSRTTINNLETIFGLGRGCSPLRVLCRKLSPRNFELSHQKKYTKPKTKGFLSHTKKPLLSILVDNL